MRNKDYQKIISKIFEEILLLTDKKSHDYAKDEDTLYNFKSVASILTNLYGREFKQEDVAMFFIVVKICRLMNLKDKNPECESVRDTILDAINYIGLYYATKIEK